MVHFVVSNVVISWYSSRNTQTWIYEKPSVKTQTQIRSSFVNAKFNWQKSRLRSVFCFRSWREWRWLWSNRQEKHWFSSVNSLYFSANKALISCRTSNSVGPAGASSTSSFFLARLVLFQQTWRWGKEQYRTLQLITALKCYHKQFCSISIEKFAPSLQPKLVEEERSDYVSNQWSDCSKGVGDDHTGLPNQSRSRAARIFKIL